MFSIEEFVTGSTAAANGDGQQTTQANSDVQLFSALCEIDKNNYLYLFERCKAFNINARQLRYLEKEHIRRIIAADQVGIMAEFEHLHGLWRKSLLPLQAQPQLQIQPPTQLRQTQPTILVPLPSPPITAVPSMLSINSTPTSNSNASPATNSMVDLEPSTSQSRTRKTLKRKFDFGKHNNNHFLHEGEHEYPLDDIIPHDMGKVREEYRKNGILTERERRQLASSLVEYFKSNNIYMSKHIMESLAIQISTIFPTESKRAWHDTEGKQRRGRLTLKLYNMQRARKMQKSKFDEDDGQNLKQTSLTNSMEDLDETTQNETVISETDEADRLQLWLRNNKCEDNDELVQMWYESTGYRTKQLEEYTTSDGEHLSDVFDKWPAYKQTIGPTLMSIDFNTMYPNSESIFYERWPIFMKKIQKLYKLEVRLDLYEQYYKNASKLNDETKQYVLMQLLHAIVRPTRPINPKQMARRYTIVESQTAFSRIVTNVCEMDDYTEAKPMIFILGAIFNVEKVFVVFKNIRYELNFMDAIFTCLQIFHIFKLDFPLACMNFWTFVQTYFFNIAPEPGTNLAVIDHIIKFLLV